MPQPSPFLQGRLDLTEFLYCDGPPSDVSGPYDLKDGNHVPHFQMRWERFRKPRDLEEQTNNCSVTVEVDLEKKTITGLSIISNKIWQNPPKVDVEPELEKDYRKRVGGTMFIRSNAPPLLPERR